MTPDQRIFGPGAEGAGTRMSSRFTPPSGSILSDTPGTVIPAPPIPSYLEEDQTAGFVESFHPPDPATLAIRAHQVAQEDASPTGVYTVPEDELALDDPLRLLSINQKDFLLASLIAGRTTATIRRYYLARFKVDIEPKTVRRFKNRNISAVLEGRTERYRGVKKEGLAMAEERILQLAANAELIQARIMSQANNGDPISLKHLREYRETLDDIAQEVGHRRRGLDVDAGLIVSVIQGPRKADTEDEWERQAQAHLTDGQTNELGEISNDSPPQLPA